MSANIYFKFSTLLAVEGGHRVVLAGAMWSRRISRGPNFGKCCANVTRREPKSAIVLARCEVDWGGLI